jgi:hypothetical protein
VDDGQQLGHVVLHEVPPPVKSARGVCVRVCAWGVL